MAGPLWGTNSEENWAENMARSRAHFAGMAQLSVDELFSFSDALVTLTLALTLTLAPTLTLTLTLTLPIYTYSWATWPTMTTPQCMARARCAAPR